MESIPQIGLKMEKDPGKILEKINLPVKLREVMGSNISELARYQDRKMKKEQQIQKKEKVKRMLYEQYKEKKLKEMNVEEREELKEKEERRRLERLKEKEKLREEQRPVNYKMDESGRILDSQGNILNLKTQQL